MKVVDFNDYSDSQIKELRIKLSNPNPEKDKMLPPKIFEFLNKETPQIGNVQTRVVRCINLLNQQIVSRFLNNDYGSSVSLTKEEIVKCIVVIINFLIISDDEVEKIKDFNTPSHLQMNDTLRRFGHDMISFTEYLSGEKLWEFSPKEFFQDSKKTLKFFTEKLNFYLQD